MMKLLTHTWIALAAVLLSPQTFAAKVGDPLPELTLKDQFDKPHTLDGSVRRLYANADRKGDGLMKSAKELTQAKLDAQKAIVIADISKAPFFVKRIIRSSLKDRSYTTWLDASGSTQKWLPQKSDQVLVLDVEHGRIKAIRYAKDAAALQHELAQP